MAPRPQWLETALHHHLAGRFPEAERIYESILKVEPEQPDALNLLALIAAQRGRFDLAVQLIERAIASAPGRGDFYIALGNVHLASGRGQETIQCYRRGLSLTRFSCIPTSFAELASHAGETPYPCGPGSEIEAYRSQVLQDVYLDRWVFGRKRDGVFVDIGAHDEVSLSNSCFFEQQRGWTGLCVKPNPAVFDRLRANRGCAVANCCVANEAATVAFRKLSGPAEMLSGIVASYHPDHLARVEKELQDFGGSSDIIQMEAHSLNGLCERHGISHIDYLSIDTEGSEFDILNAADFTKLLVHAATVECNFETDRQRLIAVMDRHGFDMAMPLVHDLLFLNRESPWHAEHAAGPRPPVGAAQRLVR